MQAGQLNEKIQIYDLVKVKDDFGRISENRVLSYDTRAKVGHISGSRTVINSEIQTPYVKNFVIRIYVPVNDTSWIKYNDKFYRVTSIDKNTYMQQQVITAEEVNE